MDFTLDKLEEGFYAVRISIAREPEIYYFFEEKGMWNAVKDGLCKPLTEDIILKAERLTNKEIEGRIISLEKRVEWLKDPRKDLELKDEQSQPKYTRFFPAQKIEKKVGLLMRTLLKNINLSPERDLLVKTSYNVYCTNSFVLVNFLDKGI